MVIKTARIIIVEHVVVVEETSNICTVSFLSETVTVADLSEDRDLYHRITFRCNFKKCGCYWIQFSQDKVSWQAFRMVVVVVMMLIMMP
jgi:hypothetical protein